MGRAKEVIPVVRGTENPNKMTVLDRISLDRALKQLPPGYRSVFVLHDVEGHEHGEKILGVAVGTSKSQLYKARMKLRQMLKQSLDVLVPDRLETLLPNLGGQVYSE